jgi:hypothetical protein
MAVINVFAADTDAEARRLSTSMQQSFAAVVSGKPGKLKPPVDDIDAVLAQILRDRKPRHSAG